MLNVFVDRFPPSGLRKFEKAVTRYEMREAMRELFELTVELLIRDAALDMGSS